MPSVLRGMWNPSSVRITGPAGFRRAFPHQMLLTSSSSLSALSISDALVAPPAFRFGVADDAPLLCALLREPGGLALLSAAPPPTLVVALGDAVGCSARGACDWPAVDSAAVTPAAGRLAVLLATTVTRGTFVTATVTVVPLAVTVFAAVAALLTAAAVLLGCST